MTDNTLKYVRTVSTDNRSVVFHNIAYITKIEMVHGVSDSATGRIALLTLGFPIPDDAIRLYDVHFAGGGVLRIDGSSSSKMHELVEGIIKNAIE